MNSRHNSLAQGSIDGTLYTTELPGLLGLPTEVRLLIYKYAGLAPENFLDNWWYAQVGPDQRKTGRPWSVFRPVGVCLSPHTGFEDIMQTFRSIQQACRQTHHEVTAEFGYPARLVIQLTGSMRTRVRDQGYRFPQIQEPELQRVRWYSFHVPFRERSDWSSERERLAEILWVRKAAHLHLCASANGKWQASWITAPLDKWSLPIGRNWHDGPSDADMRRVIEEIRSSVEHIVCTKGMNLHSLNEVLDTVNALSLLAERRS